MSNFIFKSEWSEYLLQLSNEEKGYVMRSISRYMKYGDVPVVDVAEDDRLNAFVRVMVEAQQHEKEE